MISRLRLCRTVCATTATPPGTRGRPRLKGARLPSLADRLADPATRWRRTMVDHWYGRGAPGSTSPPAPRSGTIPACGCRSAGCSCVIQGREGAAGFPQHRPEADPSNILPFVRRWRIETTFEEAGDTRCETQRQGRTSHPAHHAGAVRTVLVGDPLGDTARSGTRHLT